MSDTATQPVGKVGRLTENPELRSGKTGTAWCSFGLAVRPYTPAGQPEQPTTFYEVVAFGSLAEHAAECLLKGDRVVVTGKGELERWTGRDGVERTKKKIVADAVGPDLRFASADIQRGKPDALPRLIDDEEPF